MRRRGEERQSAKVEVDTKDAVGGRQGHAWVISTSAGGVARALLLSLFVAVAARWLCRDAHKVLLIAAR